MADQDEIELTRNVVRALLTAHGLPVTDREVAALATLQPGLRRRMARLYAVDCGDLGPVQLGATAEAAATGGAAR